MGDDVRPHSVTITDEWGSVETIGIEPDEEIAVVKKTPLPLTASNHAISATPGYDGDEWFTPAEYIEAARDVMGSIDLDPASTSEAQKVVGAVRFFSKDDNGLMQTWNGNVFLNPPYSVPLIQEFVEKVMFEFDAGNIAQAIVLTNNSSDTKWFHSLLSRFPACFTRGRVQFWRPNLETFGTRQGQTFFYIGPNVNRFRAVFSEFGIVVSV
jgi:ParB family chromosome partitioning protein